MLETLIRETMEKILFGNTPILLLLKNQYLYSTISSIEKSEAGCYVDFEIDDNVEKASPTDFEIGDVYIKTTNMKFGMGTLLFVRNGLINMLEFYTYGGDDPMLDTYDNYSLSYGENDIRDFTSYIS